MSDNIPTIRWTLRDATPEELAADVARKLRRQKFEDAVAGYDSGCVASCVLSLDMRLRLIEAALDCASDGNGPPDLENCYRLIYLVENGFPSNG